jgi:2'-phosphotransferase
MQVQLNPADAGESHNGEKSTKPKTNKRSPKFRSREGEVGISKTISWVLRHGAKEQGLYIRPDGYVRVDDLVGGFVCQDVGPYIY